MNNYSNQYLNNCFSIHKFINMNHTSYFTLLPMTVRAAVHINIIIMFICMFNNRCLSCIRVPSEFRSMFS